MAYQNFSPDIESLATECRAAIFTDEPFDVTGQMAGGGTSAFPVTMKHSGRMAWVKPARIGGNGLLHVAHEKIASDNRLSRHSTITSGVRLRHPILR